VVREMWGSRSACWRSPLRGREGGRLVFVGLLLGGFVAGIFGTAGAAEVGVVAGGQELCERGFIAACAGARARFFHSFGLQLDGELFVAVFVRDLTTAFGCARRGFCGGGL